MWSQWTESIKKRVCRYLIQRYLGQYLQKKIEADQLSVDLYNGTGRVKDVELDCQALNLLAEQQNIPIEFKEGRLDSISASIPWSSIMQESCEIQVVGLQVTVQPKNRFANGGSMLDSMWTSMQASSMQLAEECLKSCDEEEKEFENQEPLSGLEHCAQTIDAVLSRVKMCFVDTIIRIEYSQKDINLGIALEFHLKEWKYSDETCSDKREDRKVYESAFSLKKIEIRGITVYCDLYKNISQYLFQGDTGEKERDNLILIGKMTGLHEIILKIKKDESIIAPQLSVDCNLGSLIGFLSPMQAHVLLKLAQEFFNPNSNLPDEDMSKVFGKEKLMDYFDFERVQKELDEHLKPGMIGLQPGVLQQHGWSSPMSNDDDDEFLPMKSKSGGMQSSIHSNLLNTSITTSTCSMQQSMSESVSSVGEKSNFYHSAITMNSKTGTTEKTKFNLSLASALITILHEETLILSTSSAVVNSTVDTLKGYSKQFFEKLGIFGLTISGKKDVLKIRETLNNSCNQSHTRFVFAPVKLEGTDVVEDSIPIFSGTISVGFCEIVEYLKKESILSGTPCLPIDVLSFPDSWESGHQSLKIEFRNKVYKKLGSKTSLKFNLKEFNSEIDISMIDRLSSLLYPKLPFFQSGNHSPKYQEPDHITQGQSVYMIKVKSPSCAINFRFPIPDLRPGCDLSRVPYWKRNLRNDSVIIKMKDFNFSTVLNSYSPVSELDLTCQFASLFYKETQESNPIHFGSVSSDDPEIDGPSLQAKGYDWPRVQVWIYPETGKDTVTVESEVSDEGDSIENIMNQKNKESSPFSSRKIIHESSSHTEENNVNNGSSTESVIPGNRIEMENFIDANKNTHYRIELNLRSVNLSLPSKQFFENIYNRVSTDLLLWEPYTPKSFESSSDTQFHGCYAPPQNAFSMCKSGIKLDSESDSEEEMSAFYTPNDNKRKTPDKKPDFAERGQNEVTLRLFISKGTCSLYTPFLDTFGNTVPEKKGQITFKIDQGNLFIVSSYKGNRDLGYLCLYANKGSFFHHELFESDDIPELPDYSPKLNIRKVVYPIEDGMITKISSNTPTLEHIDMLSLAIRIERDPPANIKTFKVAMAIQDGIMDHKISLPNRLWFHQIVEFFDVRDALVPGYIPSAIITEFHLHLWNCAVIYNPLFLPIRSVLTVENFSISSNIAALTNTSVLRFMAEDAAFFLSAKQSPVSSIDLKNDYVCVIDMDFLELCVRICKLRDTLIPRFEFTASNNVLNIRTCSDSLKALLELITYCANDGDLNELRYNFTRGSEEVLYSPSSLRDGGLIDGEITSQPGDLLVETQQQMGFEAGKDPVHDLVSEAMKESKAQFCGLNKEEYKKSGKGGIELHFTPKEDEMFEEGGGRLREEPQLIFSRMMMDPIMETSDGLPVDINPDEEDEEEFFVLENEAGTGIMPKNGEPEARVLIDEPIQLIENYFAPPLGKTDILKAPKHYPNPIMRYTLQEMSIVFHMYGGEDFGPGGKENKVPDEASGETPTESKKMDSFQMNYEQNELDFGIDALNPGAVSYKTKCFESVWETYESPKIQTKHPLEGSNWRNQGGKGRNHDFLLELHLNKIKISHEVYPENTEQASRQVIVVNNVEIRDRLRSSQYNKMLYLYTSSTRPKQSHAHMIFIKAAHLRSDPQRNIEECVLKISLLPIRLNIDQDAILFLYQFLNESILLKPDLDDEEMLRKMSSQNPTKSSSMESLPIRTLNNVDLVEEGAFQGALEDDLETPNLINLTCESTSPPQDPDNISLSSKTPSVDSSRSSFPIFFRQVMFSPEAPIRIDYHGKRVDMALGPKAGLLMGLAQLDRSEIYLKRINHRNGILGYDKLYAHLLSEWSQDIGKNQLPSLLGGVGPMYSFVQLFQGVRDLFYMPIEQYQKDGRIAKGLQKGANAFSASTALAALELSNRFVKAIQSVGEFTFDMVSPGPSVHQQRRQSSSKRKRIQQPSDIREGMTNAYHVVREGIGETAQNIVKVASKEHEQKGVSGAVGGVLRQIPPTVVKPIILVAEATSNVLEGFRSQLEPEFKKESEEKWKE